MRLSTGVFFLAARVRMSSWCILFSQLIQFANTFRFDLTCKQVVNGSVSGSTLKSIHKSEPSDT